METPYSIFPLPHKKIWKPIDLFQVSFFFCSLFTPPETIWQLTWLLPTQHLRAMLRQYFLTNDFQLLSWSETHIGI